MKGCVSVCVFGCVSFRIMVDAMDPHRRDLPGSDGATAVREGRSAIDMDNSNVLRPRPVPMPRRPMTERCETGIENSIEALNLGGDPHQVLMSVQTKVEDLRKEEAMLQEHIVLLQREKARLEQSDSQFEELRKKELDLAEREHNLHLMRNQMESENSDNDFKLSQKRRELQHLEDQLHMKSKDLKQKEFDLANAESPADISGSQLAEMADRQYELDHREQELNFQGDRLREWSSNLREKEIEYQRRLDELQRREASFYTSSRYYNSTPDYERQHPQEQQHQERPGLNPPLNHAPSPTGRVRESSVPGFRYDQPVHYDQGDYQDQRSAGYSSVHERMPIAEQPVNYQTNTPPQGGISSQDGISPQGGVPGASPQGQGGVHDASPQGQGGVHGASPRQGQGTSPQGQGGVPGASPQGPIGKDEQNPRRQRQCVSSSSDEQLARQLMEEEEKTIKTTIYTDEMLALALQHEEMDSGSQIGGSGEVASIIKKELDERLTEEQRKKIQEEEDFKMAQLLSSNTTSDDT